MGQLINLVIVDMQNDFMDDGKLPVKGAYQAKNVIEQYIEDYYDEIGWTIISKDLHPKNHCSFKKCGGLYPEHCVKYTNGADLSFDTSLLYGIPQFWILKGMNKIKDELSAFKCCYEYSKHYIALSNNTNDLFLSKHDEYVVCGVAGDICVLETLKDMIKYIPVENITVLWTGVASIDGGEKLSEFCKINDIKIHNYGTNNQTNYN